MARDSGRSKSRSETTDSTKNNDVIDFSEVRAKKLEEKRRNTSRVLFKQILGIYTVTGESQMRSLELIDVSEDGCSFQVPFDAQNPWPTDLKEIPIRMYFSQDTYLPLQLRIQNSRPSIENGIRYIRYGCAIDPTFKSYEAFRQFVRFLRVYSEHAHQDLGGDHTLFYL